MAGGPLLRRDPHARGSDLPDLLHRRGADIHLDELASVGIIGTVYVVARTVGKVGGSAIGVLPAGLDELRVGVHTGMALLPHAGMAIALAAFVSEFAPELGVAGVTGRPGIDRGLRAVRTTDSTACAAIRGRRGQCGQERRVRARASATRTLRKVLIPVGNRTVIVPRMPFLLDLVGSLGAEVVAVHVAYPSTDDEDDEPEVLAMFREVADSRGITCTTVHRRSDGPPASSSTSPRARTST